MRLVVQTKIVIRVYGNGKPLLCHSHARGVGCKTGANVTTSRKLTCVMERRESEVQASVYSATSAACGIGSVGCT